MSVTRFEIVKVFSDPTYLFFEHGVIWGGDAMNSACVLYRMNGRVQELVTNKHGALEGLRATYHPSGSPRSFRHYRKGNLIIIEQEIWAHEVEVRNQKLRRVRVPKGAE